jgi:hypothetical protein
MVEQLWAGYLDPDLPEQGAFRYDAMFQDAVPGRFSMRASPGARLA